MKLILILVFYPIVPAVIYSQFLWVWGIRHITTESMEKRQNLAREIRGDVVRLKTVSHCDNILRDICRL